MILFFTTLEQWFWHAWDNLWRLLMWNVVLFAATVPLLTANTEPAMILALVWFVFLFGPLMTGTMAWAWPMAADQSPDLRELLRRLGRVWIRAVILHGLFALVLGLITFNLHFYLGADGQRRLGPIPGMLLAGLSLWIGIYLAAWWLYAQVAIGEDREQGPHTLLSAVRQGGRILLAHPLLSLAHMGVVAALFMFSLRTTVPLFFIWHTWTALYIATAVYEMYFESEVRAEHAQRAQGGEEARPTSWKEILADETPGGVADSYRGRRPRRSLKEIFKPWEM